MKHKILEVCVCCLAFVLAANAQTPVITSQPQSITINNASTANFSVTATNAAGYQWQFDGTSIAGATNSALLLDDVNSNQAGSYTVVVTSSGGVSVTNGTPAVLALVPGTIVQLTISRYANGNSSNIVVQLFDHDKPATVANFIHYITSGAYSNMFFDRCPGNPAVLQGGTYDAVDRTNTTPGVNAGQIYDLYVASFEESPTFPFQINSEAGVGPFIPNTFGTLAMALSDTNGVTDPDSATSAFYINLTNNSSLLDAAPNGPFTVFGRVISYGTNQNPTNVLQFFNTLTSGNGIIDYQNFATNVAVTTLPVNYDGTNEPSDANLYFCGLTFVTNLLQVVTNPPAISVAFPSPNETFVSGNLLTFYGTAASSSANSEPVGLSRLACGLEAESGLNLNNPITVFATISGSNWTAYIGSLLPGNYNLDASCQDGAGNISSAQQLLTVYADITIMTNNSGVTTAAMQFSNAVAGTVYTVAAPPEAGETFLNWSNASQASLDSSYSFTTYSNMTLTATYTSNNLPAGLAITGPAANSTVMSTNGMVTVTGTIPASDTVTQLTCQLFVASNSVTAAQPATISGSTWSVTMSNLASGNYTAVVSAEDTSGLSGFSEQNFTLEDIVFLTVVTSGAGSVSAIPGISSGPNTTYFITPDTNTYSLKATPAKGQVFAGWSDGVTTSLSLTKQFMMASNLTLTASFLPDTLPAGITFTYPPANAGLTNVAFTVKGRIPDSQSLTQMTCQLFLQSNSVTAAQPVSRNATTWSLEVSNLAPGPYTIVLVAYDIEGRSRLVSEKFNLLAKLTVDTGGLGILTPNLDGKYLIVGKRYAIKVTPKPGHLFASWSSNVATPSDASTTFVMASNTVLTATIVSNYFPIVSGTYQGLFLSDTNAAPTNSGFLSLTVTGTGAFSGRLSFPSHVYSLIYKFDYDGSIALAGTGLDANLIYIFLNLDLTGGSDAMTGSVIDYSTTSGIIWSNSLVAYREVKKLTSTNTPAPGKYVLNFEPATNGPVTADGYAAVNVSPGGAVVLAGALADNNAISQSAGVSKDGIWPVYLAPASYRGKGMVIGWETNLPAGGCDGQLFWIKPATAKPTSATYYPDGFAETLGSIGTNYVAPAEGAQYQIVFGGGSLGSTLVTNLLTVKSGKFSPGSDADKLAIALSATGVVSGHFVNSVDSKVLSFKGAFTAASQGGAGFTLDDDGQTGYFSISLDVAAGNPTSPPAP